MTPNRIIAILVFVAGAIALVLGPEFAAVIPLPAKAVVILQFALQAINAITPRVQGSSATAQGK